MANLYIRWRHRRGFGVHSPFAFAVVTNIVQNHYSYYGYDEIVESARGSHLGKQLSRARMMHRLVGRLGLCLSTPADMPELLLLAARCAGASDPVNDSAPRLCYHRSGDAGAASDVPAPFPDGSVLWAENDTEVAEATFASLSGGLLLRGRDLSLVFHRKDMVPTSYDILM